MLLSFRTICQSLGLTTAQAATLLSVPYSTACKWSAQDRPPSADVMKAARRWIVTIEYMAEAFMAHPDNLETMARTLPADLKPAVRRRILEKSIMSSERKRA